MESIVNDNMSSFLAYLEEIQGTKVLTTLEEKELFDRFNNGDFEARNKIIKHNLRLVISIAKKYSFNNISLLDLIQDGNIGLIKAIDRFDSSKGVKFSTYATFWIKEEILGSIADKYSTVRLPQYVFDILNKVNEIKENYKAKHGVEITIEELSEKLNISIDSLSNALLVSEIVSLDNPVNDDEEDVSFINSLKTEEENSLEDKVLMSEFKNMVFNTFVIPNDKIRKMIMYRFGFIDGECYTYSEIGKMFGITKEAVMQNIKRGLKQLRNNSQIRDFNPYEKEDYYSRPLKLNA